MDCGRRVLSAECVRVAALKVIPKQLRYPGAKLGAMQTGCFAEVPECLRSNPLLGSLHLQFFPSSTRGTCPSALSLSKGCVSPFAQWEPSSLGALRGKPLRWWFDCVGLRLDACGACFNDTNIEQGPAGSFYEHHR